MGRHRNRMNWDSQHQRRRTEPSRLRKQAPSDRIREIAGALQAGCYDDAGVIGELLRVVRRQEREIRTLEERLEEKTG